MTPLSSRRQSARPSVASRPGLGLVLAQLAITYSECLFHTEVAVREQVTAKIKRGTEIAAGWEAQAFLLRPGSLNPDGPWTPPVRV